MESYIKVPKEVFAPIVELVRVGLFRDETRNRPQIIVLKPEKKIVGSVLCICLINSVFLAKLRKNSSLKYLHEISNTWIGLFSVIVHAVIHRQPQL